MKYQQLDKQKSSFLIRHPDLAKKYICLHYPFRFDEFKQYQQELDWYHFQLNHKYNSTISIISKYARNQKTADLYCNNNILHKADYELQDKNAMQEILRLIICKQLITNN